MGFGARASHRLLIKLPASDGKQAEAVQAAVRKELEAALPEAQVMDYREGNPALTHGLENATAILSLICLVAMVLGAIGVAMAMHAHLAERMDMLAILKAMGAGSADLLRIFLLQTLGLGLLGGLLGVVAGLAVMAVLPRAFGSLIPLHILMQFPWRSVLMGLGTGLLTTLLFCLPPLLDVRKVRPILVLRRMVEEGPTGVRGWLCLWWNRRLQLALALLVVAALGGIAWALADSAKVGARLPSSSAWRCWCCCCWLPRRCVCCALCSTGSGSICLLRCGTGWRTSIGRVTSRLQCWPRWDWA